MSIPHTNITHFTVLVVGATGSIGRHVVKVALERGYIVRALARDVSKARRQLAGADVVAGDLTRPETLVTAVDGVDAIIFTHGSDGSGKTGSEAVDYGGVRNVLRALGRRRVRIALMTAIGVTNRESAYNRQTESADWKRRGERLVRASGLPYTIVRPGWFDYNRPDQQKLLLLQGDRRHSGTPNDGVIARRQIAEVLVASLTSEVAVCKSFELVAETGATQQDLNAMFTSLEADPSDALDAVHDLPNQPLVDEPQRVREELAEVRERRSSNATP